MSDIIPTKTYYKDKHKYVKTIGEVIGGYSNIDDYIIDLNNYIEKIEKRAKKEGEPVVVGHWYHFGMSSYDSYELLTEKEAEEIKKENEAEIKIIKKRSLNSGLPPFGDSFYYYTLDNILEAKKLAEDGELYLLNEVHRANRRAELEKISRLEEIEKEYEEEIE